MHTSWILGYIFGGETEGIWTSVLHGNCNCICELDVRLLNHPNWTFIAQVMVHFLGLPQATLFDPTYYPDFGTDFRSGKIEKLD